MEFGWLHDGGFLLRVETFGDIHQVIILRCPSLRYCQAAKGRPLWMLNAAMGSRKELASWSKVYYLYKRSCIAPAPHLQVSSGLSRLSDVGLPHHGPHVPKFYIIVLSGANLNSQTIVHFTGTRTRTTLMPMAHYLWRFISAMLLQFLEISFHKG